MPREKIISATPAKRRPRKAALAITEVQPVFTPFVDPEQRAALIAEAAYFRAERRGFAPGHETEDWLAAEAEIDAKLLRAATAPGA